MTDLTLWALVALQIAMGAFDTLYHHEFTERLAWRPNAGQELALHAVRNGFYGAIFLTLAWCEPHGLLAAALLVALVIEIGITLWDFVEEDLTRRLPATERVTHTLLALNYGAILSLLIPILWGWAHMQTGWTAVSHGYGSFLLSAAALGVSLFGIRDWFAMRRAAAFVTTPAASLADALPDHQRILITGATGFVGERLLAALSASGHEVTALVRSPEKAAKLGMPIRLITSLEQLPPDTRLDAVINLAGAPVADWPWTRANRFRILHSRLKTLRRLNAWLARLHTPPRVLISASAIGWYGPQADPVLADQMLTEQAPAGDGFAGLTCRVVESEALRASAHGLRVVNLRIGLVLDRAGGVLARMLPAFDLGLGGPMGSGRQWMSWISRDDLVRLIAHAVVTETLEGAVNATAPAPVRGQDFAHALGKALKRPAVLAVPAWLLRLVGGQMAEEILLSGQPVTPAKALTSGFHFKHPTLATALASALGQPAADPSVTELSAKEASVAGRAAPHVHSRTSARKDLETIFHPSLPFRSSK